MIDSRIVPGLTQIVEGWRSLIKLAEGHEKRKKFMKTAKMCTHFYAGAMGFMWDDTFRKDFLGSMPSPEFKITIAKGFETVAIMVPNLMWDYPGRVSSLSSGLRFLKSCSMINRNTPNTFSNIKRAPLG